jgi:hypothetical protein
MEGLNMERVQSLIWIRFDRERLYASIRDKLRGKTLRQRKRQIYHYEGTARIKDRDSGEKFESGFTL